MSEDNTLAIVGNESQPSAQVINYVAPVVTIKTALVRYNLLKEFASKILVPDHDYGAVQGIDKPALYKPGAEKLGTFFNIRPSFVAVHYENDWTGQDHGGEPFFFREYKCEGIKNGEVVGDAIGSCNSWEKKYRYRWVAEQDIPPYVNKEHLEFRDGTISEFDFAITKASTTGQYGKPMEYWNAFRNAITDHTAVLVKRTTKTGKVMDAWEIGGKQYAIPNHDPADLVNTIDKMAQKRAFVAMILITTNASDFFTQDIEDFVSDGSVIDMKPKTRKIDMDDQPDQPPEEPQEWPGGLDDFSADESYQESENGPSMTSVARSLGGVEKAVVSPRPERPYSPETLKIRIAEMIEVFKGTKNNPVTQGNRTGVRLNLVSIAGDEAKYKKLLKYLVGQVSVNDLTDEQVLALKKWLHVTKDNDAQFVPDAMAVQEGKLASLMASSETQGQLHLVSSSDEAAAAAEHTQE